MADGGTISLRDDVDARSSAGDGPCLILVLNAASPLDRPMTISLADVDELDLGRGPVRQVDQTGPRRLRVDLVDAAMSSTHARLTRAGTAWTIRDEQSKNGTLVNGRRISRCELGPGDLVELGNAFFVIRPGAAEPGASRDASPPALRTLSARLAQQLDMFVRVARARVPILLLGETGTGKEMLARAAHDISGRKGPFVAVNCGAIPATLIESELFGARKGAFSGAHTDRAGKVVAAQDGTLFLDEIAELPEASQAAMLRVLQEGEVQVLGATTPVHVDVRIVAATHHDLGERVAAARFRTDLYARLRGHVLTLPPLRERREDIGLLCAELLARAAGQRASAVVLQRAAARALLMYAWPYNIRELDQVLNRALALLDGNEVRLEHLPDEVAELSGLSGYEASPQEVRARLIQLFRAHGGNISAIARALATSRSQVKRLMVRHDIAMAEISAAGPPADAADDE